MFGRGVANMDITPLGEECRAEIELRMFPGASAMWVATPRHRFEKGRDPGKSDDDCRFRVVEQSWTCFKHLGKQIVVGGGAGRLLVVCGEDENRKRRYPSSM